MSNTPPMTAEDFVTNRHELPEGGRWVELEAGELVVVNPPTAEHGTTILNLSKALARYTQAHPEGYACFELGLLVRRKPDTLRFPAIAYFNAGPMFAESDKDFTETRPALIVELASTNDRRRRLEQRLADWLAWGVPTLWSIDPQQREVHVIQQGRGGMRLKEHQNLPGESVLPGFQMRIGELFVEPDWSR